MHLDSLVNCPATMDFPSQEPLMVELVCYFSVDERGEECAYGLGLLQLGSFKSWKLPGVSDELGGCRCLTKK